MFCKLRFDRSKYLVGDIGISEIRSKLGSPFALKNAESWADIWKPLEIHFRDESDRKNVVALPDITCWFTDELILNAKAYEHLGEAVQPYGELLPAVAEGIPYWVFHVAKKTGVCAVVTYTAGDGDGLAVVSDIQIKLDKKLIKGAGKFTMNAGDQNGTYVGFGVAFLDANVPNVKLNTTEVHDIIVDIVDQPNPEGFRVYAVLRSDGQRLSGPATWDVNGFGRIG